MPKDSFQDKLKDTLYWWLAANKPFIINDEYEIRLIVLDKKRNTVKLEISNLKKPKEESSNESL